MQLKCGVQEEGECGLVAAGSQSEDAIKDRAEEPLIPIDLFIIDPRLLCNPGPIIPEGPRGLSMR